MAIPQGSAALLFPDYETGRPRQLGLHHRGGIVDELIGKAATRAA